MKKSIAILLALMMLFSVVFVACGTPAAKTETKTEATTEPAKTEAAKFDPSKIPVVFATPVTGHPVIKIVSTGFLSRMKELGYPAQVVGDESGADLAKITAAAQAAISQGAKGVMFWYDASAKASVDAFKAMGPDIKVVMPHSVITKEQIPSLDANIAFDTTKEGESAAIAMGEKLKGKKGSIAITQGGFGDTENKVAARFAETMKSKYPDLKVLNPVEEGFDAPKAIGIAAGIIQANPDIIGAFSTTGGGPVTWAGAMDQSGKKDLVCIGMDYTEANVALVKEGKIYAIVAQPLYDEAVECANILDKLLRGEEVPFYTELPAPVVTKDGIDKYDDILKKVKEWFK